MSAELQRIDGSALGFITASQAERPSSIVLLLHGFGADCRDLAPFAGRLAARVAGALFVAPNAPSSIVEDMSATERAQAARTLGPEVDWEARRTWLSLPTSDSSGFLDGLQKLKTSLRPPIRAVNRFADLLLARHSLSSSRLVVFGFSQGGMLAILVGLGRDQPCAGVISHSGQFFGAPDIRSRPRMLLIAGEKETVQKVVLPASVTALKLLGVRVHAQKIPGLGHSLNADSIDRIAAFLSKVLPG